MRYPLEMRRWLALVFALGGCAATKPPLEAPTPPSLLDQVQQHACTACRMNLQACLRDAQIREASAPTSPCMGEFMACLDTQHIDSVRCSSF
jgi:hypothetical protein